MLHKILIPLGMLLLISACMPTSEAEKFAKANPGDVYGILAKAEAGDKNVSCTEIRQGAQTANALATKKIANITELSLPGRYQGVSKRYGC